MSTSVKDAPTGARSGASQVFRIPDLRRARREDWAQLVRFCVVGTSGYLVNLAVFATLHVLDVHYAAAAVASFCVAWAWNFALNRSWTFRAGRQRSMLAQGARYLLVSGLALGANLGILHLLVQAGLPEIPAQAIAIVAVTPVSFLANRRWSFR